jgi:hypothetical protein
MGAFDKPITREEIFQAKAEQRKVKAKASFESKLQDLLRLQRINFVMKKAAGRKAPRPWNMSEAEYFRENQNTLPAQNP